METVSYKREKLDITIDVTDLSAGDFLQEMIRLMQMIGYFNETIKKALDEAYIE